MPTHAQKPAFAREFKRLSAKRAALFETRLEEFIDDLLAMEEGRLDWFRPQLRVKKVRGAEGLYEMTWDRDGRATFAWGAEQRPGKRHVVWVQIGGHEILP